MMMTNQANNVLGTALQPCCYQPMTGWFRDGFCNTSALDTGIHTVCVIVDDRFLTYSKSMGNDLSTPMPEYQFPGLKAGDKWCLCAARWKQAFDDGMACPVVLEATHERTLDVVSLETLESFAFVPASTEG